jgi:hypothetical protein
MISTTKELLEKFLAEHPEVQGTALEVGSLDVNGNIRELLKGFKYIASDMQKGDNVDVIINGHDLVKKFGKDSMDLVICFDTLEHDEKPWLTVDQMRKVLKSGGWMLLAAPSLNHGRHNHPYDYYRYFGTAFHVFFEGFKNVVVREDIYGGQDDLKPDEVLGYGQKP